jgi:hypothetical protein
MLGTFASFGGIGYAASGASHAAQTLADLATAKKVKVHSAAADQYAPPPKAHAQAPAQAAAQPGAAEAVAQARALPFTGLSLVGTALLGIALIAIGLALRRRERRAR